MKTLLITAAFAAAIVTPSVAAAQAVPAAIVAVVDLDKVTADCNACKTANAALQSQASTIKARQQALTTPLETEAKSLQAAVDALKGKEPDAALKTRADAFNKKRQDAAEEMQRREQEFQRNQEYVRQQIATKIRPIYQQVMQKRGANILVEVGATLATSTSVDVTNDVLTALNAALPSIATTAPAPAKPQGR
ncbi:MAG TPA: OmpH family outer membrane protein [Sphingomicrobium sp.]|jgi:Skp family chaperone for outer membrane proteins|nr:OmpH family outer membrane protein [Sphingomicrobium sp.]HET7577493.1 OmpH family outer membrane protein [Sphingomicrobium sp.]